MGIYYLLKEVNPLYDPLGAENKMILACGPLTGTLAPTGARYMVNTKSPLTGAITEPIPAETFRQNPENQAVMPLFLRENLQNRCISG